MEDILYYKEFKEVLGTKENREDTFYLGLTDNGPVFSNKGTALISIAGKPGSGKTNAVNVLMSQAVEKEYEVYCIDFRDVELPSIILNMSDNGMQVKTNIHAYKSKDVSKFLEDIKIVQRTGLKDLVVIFDEWQSVAEEFDDSVLYEFKKVIVRSIESNTIVILASQSLNNKSYTILDKLKDVVYNKYLDLVLPVNKEVSELLLKSNEAAILDDKGVGIVRMNRSNTKVRIPFIPMEELKETIKE